MCEYGFVTTPGAFPTVITAISRLTKIARLGNALNFSFQYGRVNPGYCTAGTARTGSIHLSLSSSVVLYLNSTSFLRANKQFSPAVYSVNRNHKETVSVSVEM